MNKNLRWKVITILAVLVIFFGIGVYPILAQRYSLPAPGWMQAKQLKLGLDLKGGVHLVLRVHTDDALRITTTTTSEQLREALRNANVNVGAITVQSPLAFRVEGVPQDKDAEFRSLADQEAATNYERNSGVGGSYDFTMKQNIERNLREQTVVQALDTIDRRVNDLGVAEPTIARHGNQGDQILVQMPGVTEVARAKEIIRNTAILELKLVEAGPAPSREALLQSRNGVLPPDMEVVTGAAQPNSGETGTVYFLVRKVAAVTGRDLRGAQPSMDENGRPAVSFTLNADGSRKFAAVTSANIGRALSIILDNRVQSYPTIEGRISNEGRISGNFTPQETADLSLILRSGALPASMSYLE